MLGWLKRLLSRTPPEASEPRFRPARRDDPVETALVRTSDSGDGEFRRRRSDTAAGPGPPKDRD
jgi:hypothetical protein